ncbi:TPA: RHS repeat domain-containing protein, partial [Elizabethkingia anophelis]
NGVLQFVPTSEGYYDVVKNKYIYNYTDHLGNVRLSYTKGASGGAEIIEENNYYPFGLKHQGYNSSSLANNAYQYKYNGKELQETGMYDYGARMYMPELGRWGGVDPLAEKYQNMSPYNYVANNPLMFIDPNGKDLLPVLYRRVNVRGNAIGEEYRSYNQFIKAMTDFGKTSYGKELIGSFLEKGSQQYGVKGNGKYAKYTLELRQFDLSGQNYQYLYMGAAEGNFNVQEVNGKLHIIMSIDAKDKNPESLTETITHELTLHGYRISDIIKAYEKGGIEAAKKILPDDGGNEDHESLDSNNKNHPGVNKYNQIKNELIKINPNYKKEFKNTENEQQQ